MLSITVDGLQVDNQLPSALFPALLRPRPLPPARRLPDGTKAPVGLIQLDGLAPRSADRPPALHFFAKRRASDSSHAAGGSAGAAKRPSLSTPGQRTSFSKLGEEGGGSPGGGGEEAGGAVNGVGGAEDIGGGGSREEELDMVVYYYDVATIWIRPVDLKVIGVSMFWFCLCVWYTGAGFRSEAPRGFCEAVGCWHASLCERPWQNVSSALLCADGLEAHPVDR